MVKNDFPITKNHISDKVSASQTSLALPMDRLGSFIFDLFVVVLPAYELCSFMYKNAWLSSKFSGNEPASFLYLFILTLIFSVIFILYQTVSLVLYQATLGQRFLKIKVVHLYSKDKFSIYDAFIRSVFLWVNTILFGILSLEMFRDEKRRTLYDKVSDLKVVYMNSNRKGTGQPTESERSFVRGMYMAFIMYVFIMFMLPYFMVRDSEFLQGKSEVTECIDNADLSLDLSLALYQVNKLAESCLEAKAQKSLDSGNEKALAYLAMSVIESQRDGELSNRYLKQVCREDKRTDSCMVSEFLLHWDKTKPYGALVNSTKNLQSLKSVSASIWSVNSLINLGEWSTALAALERLKDLPSLKSYYYFKQAIILWNKDNKEKAHDYFNILSLIEKDGEESFSINRQSCFLNMKQGCDGEKSETCANFFQEESDYLMSEQKAFIFYKQAQCNNSSINQITDSFEKGDIKLLGITQALLSFAQNPEAFSYDELDYFSKLEQEAFLEEWLKLVGKHFSNLKLYSAWDSIQYPYYKKKNIETVKAILQKKGDSYYIAKMNKWLFRQRIKIKEIDKLKNLKLRLPASVDKEGN